MVDTTFDIELRNGATIPATFAVNSLSELNNKTRGDTATFAFEIETGNGDATRPSNLVVSEETTIASNESETHNITTVESGATLTVDGVLNTGKLVVDGTLTGDGQVTVDDPQTHTVKSGETEIYGTLSIGQFSKVIVEGVLIAEDIINNGFLDNNNRIYNGFTAEGFIQRLDDYAGKFTVSETLAASQQYREFIPVDTRIESLLLGIEPSTDLQNKDIGGIWGLVQNVTDSRNQAISTTRHTLEVQILERYREYETHTDVERDLQN